MGKVTEVKERDRWGCGGRKGKGGVWQDRIFH